MLTAEGDVASVTVNDGEPVGYTTIYEALNYANKQTEATTVTLLQDCNLTQMIRIGSENTSANVTLELKEYTLTYDSNYRIIVDDGTLTITSGAAGKIIASNTWGAVDNNDGTLHITGGEYINSLGDAIYNNGTLTISGGTFTSTMDRTGYDRIYGLEMPGNGTCMLTGGTFSGIKSRDTAFKSLLADGYTFYEGVNTDGNVCNGMPMTGQYQNTVTVGKTHVARITLNGSEKGYPSLAEAIDEAQKPENEGCTVMLLDHVTTTEQINATTGKFTLDFSGKTWSYDREDSGADALFINGADVTLTATDGGGMTYSSFNGLGKLLGIKSGRLTIHGGTYDSDSSSSASLIYANGLTQQNQLTITGGSFRGKSNSTSTPLFYSYYCGADTIAIRGGSFSSTYQLSTQGIVFYVSGNRGTNTSADLLAEGYAFKQGDNWLEASDTYIKSDNTQPAITVEQAPVKITTQPTADKELIYGSTVSLNVATDTTEGVTYQWMDNDVDIDGEVTDSYTTPANLTIGSHRFICKVKRDGWTVKTSLVAITVVKVTGTVSDLSIDGWTYGDYSAERNKPTSTSATNTTTPVYEYKLATEADSAYDTERPEDAGSYSVRVTYPEMDYVAAATATTTFTIEKRTVTPSLTGVVTKTYDGTKAVPAVHTLAVSLANVLPADAGKVDVSAVYEYADANAGNGIEVSAAGIELTGEKSGNYVLSDTTVSAKAGTITKKPVSDETVIYPAAATGNTYGIALSQVELTGGSTELGSFEWKDGTQIPIGGTKDYTVVFTPNAHMLNNYESYTNTEKPVAVTMEAAVPEITMRSRLTGNDTGRTLTFTVTLSKSGQGAFPEGNVRFLDVTTGSETLIQSVELKDGVAVCEWTGRKEQLYKVRAVYDSSNANYKTVDTGIVNIDTNNLLTVEGIPDQTYTGSAITPAVTVIYNGELLVAGTDYSCTYSKNKAVGTALITIKGKGSFTNQVTKTFRIVGRSMEDANIQCDNTIQVVKAKANAAKAPALEFNVKLNGIALKNGRDYTLTLPSQADWYKTVGTYPVVINAKAASLSGARTVSVRVVEKKEKQSNINKVKLTAVDGSALNLKAVYDGTEKKLAFVVTDTVGGKKVTLNEGTDYTVAYSNNVSVGKAVLFLKGQGSYTGLKKVNFTITPITAKGEQFRVVSASGDSDIQTDFVKGGARPEIKVLYQGSELAAGRDYTISYGNNKKVAAAGSGKAPYILVKPRGNYKAESKIRKEFTITEANLSQTALTANDVTYKANKKDNYKTGINLVDRDSTALKAGLDYEKELSYTVDGQPVEAGKNYAAGTKVTVTITGKGSYTGTKSADFLITDKTSIEGFTVKIAKKSYKGMPIILGESDISVYKGGTNNRVTLTMQDSAASANDGYAIVGYEKNQNKGTAYVLLRGTGKYQGLKKVKFTIGSCSLEDSEIK